MSKYNIDYVINKSEVVEFYKYITQEEIIDIIALSAAAASGEYFDTKNGRFERSEVIQDIVAMMLKDFDNLEDRTWVDFLWRSVSRVSMKNEKSVFQKLGQYNIYNGPLQIIIKNSLGKGKPVEEMKKGVLDNIDYLMVIQSQQIVNNVLIPFGIGLISGQKLSPLIESGSGGEGTAKIFSHSSQRAKGKGNKKTSIPVPVEMRYDIYIEANRELKFYDIPQYTEECKKRQKQELITDVVEKIKDKSLSI